METHFIIKDSAARMPRSCWGQYKRLAVIEVPLGVTRVSMISWRARNVIRIVCVWENLHVGTTFRSAYGKALLRAKDLSYRLNVSTKSKCTQEYNLWIKGKPMCDLCKSVELLCNASFG